MKNNDYIKVNKIKSKKKKFDHDSFIKYDKEKYRSIEYFKNLGYTAEVYGHYDEDLIVTMPDGHQFLCEVEVKNNWDSVNFPFSDINVLARKNKFFTNNKYPTLLMMYNKNKTHALFLKGKDILTCPLKEVKNKEVKDGEYFYKVPVKYARFAKIEV